MSPDADNVSLKLTAYFAERQRTGSRFLAEAMLDLFARRQVATSVVLRGISGFGRHHIIRTDESLTLSEDPSVAIAAVDHSQTIRGLVDGVVDMTSSGLITLERAQLIDGEVDGVTLPPAAVPGDAVKLTIYVGRNRRADGVPTYKLVCEVLRANGFTGASVFLGVDGTAHGERRRAHFVGRNIDVPLMIIAIGSADRVRASRDELAALLERPLVTVERTRVCKREGVLLSIPPALPEVDEHGRPLWQKLMVATSEDSRHDGAPIHRTLVRRLWQSGSASGATVLRGIWGYHGDQEPHGDKLIQFGRKVPVLTVVVGTPASIARSFEIVDEVTGSAGLVTCEMVPALFSIGDGRRTGSTDLAEFRY
jgi:PII-like signaling protein